MLKRKQGTSNHIKMPITNKTTASYLAGLVDGEGYFGLLKSKSESSNSAIYRPVIKICMVNRPIIEWLKNSFGGFISVRKAHNNNRESYCWQLNGESAEPFVTAIAPFLRIKKKQAELILKRIKLKKLIGKDTIRGSGSNFKYPDYAIKEMERMYLEIRSLNKRGVQSERLNKTTSNEDAIV